MRALLVFLVFLLFTLTETIQADDKAPLWLQQAASQSIPTYDKSVPAVVLLNERKVTLGADGKLTVTDYYAVKILNSEGKDFAVARAFYLASASKVREMKAWLIRQNGFTVEYDKKSILDMISDSDDVYNEGRIKIIDASDDVNTGDIFGYTATTEEIPLFYQDFWSFQRRLPTLLSRYTLTLPSGWKAESLTFNLPNQIQPRVEGSTYVWELRNLPPIPPEPMSPSVESLAPSIAINYAPDDSSKAVNRAFANWLDVSRWATAIYEPQVVIDDAVASKAKELTANAKTELEKIRAIANYVQNLQYISIDIGVAYGNGYKPRPSNLVLARGYGDCKDKANLMRALLKVVKIEAYPVAIYAGDPAMVRQSWASPQQFNHCIIAIKVSNETKAETIIEHPKLGRLLIFDPTDPYTAVGDFPRHMQGSYALIIAGENGGLAKMPVTSPETNLLERNIEITLSETGEIKGKIIEKAHGQTSAVFRSEHRERSPQDYKKMLERWLTRASSGAVLENFSVSDDPENNKFQLEISFSISGYGQSMLDRLLVFKPVIVGRNFRSPITSGERKSPIEVDSQAVKETIVYNLPKDFVVDEMPSSLDLQASFGNYSIQFEAKEKQLILKRTLRTQWALIPVEEYPKVKNFYARIAEAEQTPVVLARK